MRAFIVALVVVALLLGAAIGFFNAQTVSFNYLAGSLDLPLIALLVGELIVVAIVGLVLFYGRVFGLRREIRGLRRQLDAAETELKSLRSLPLKDTA